MAKHKVFKKIVNIDSKSFKRYKQDSQFKLLCLQMLLYLDVLAFGRLGISTTLPAIELIAVLIIVTWWLARKYRNNDYFVNVANYENMAQEEISYTEKERKKILKEAQDQLAKNEMAVKVTFQIVKWLLVIVVLGTLEDDIKSCFDINHFQGGMIFLIYLLAIAVVLLVFNKAVQFIMGLVLNIKENINRFIDTSIDNGLFVKDYELLKATIYILSPIQDTKSADESQSQK